MGNLPSNLVEALKAREVIPFAGAGVSRAVTDDAGQSLFPTWHGLLLAAAERLRTEGLTRKANRVQANLEDSEYLDAAQVARDALGALWFPFLKAQFDPLAGHVRQASLDLARAIWRLGSPLVVTTNYDKVLRWASPQERDLRDWTVSDRVNLVDIHRDCVGQPAVWHLHGFIDRPEEIILTPDGYSLLYPTSGQVKLDYEAALVTLRHLLTARTFLFIGFGMEKAIQRQIRWVRDTFAGAGGKHFVLVKADAQQAMEKELQGLSVQPVPFADFGQPLLDLLGELADHADSGGLRTPAPLPRMEADPKPYLEYLRTDTAFIEMRGLRLSVAEAPRFPIDDLYIPLIDEMGGARELEGGRARRTLEESLAEPRLVILGDPG
ncbi:MAG: SIR2 family protein, partial [Bryobacteraceae bacterium]